MARSTVETSSETDVSAPASGPLRVVAAENFWGSIASQVGGVHVRVSSTIASPDGGDGSAGSTAARRSAASRGAGRAQVSGRR